MINYYAQFLAQFPLITYLSPLSPPQAETKDRIILWLVGREEEGETRDPLSRQLVTLARFLGRGTEVKWGNKGFMTVDNKYYDQDKALIYLAGTATTTKNQGNKESTTSTMQSAYTALIHSTLLPALLATLYLSPPSPSPSNAPTAFLSSLLQIYTTHQSRKEIIQHIKSLRLSAGSGEGILELEQLEREGVDCIKNLEEKFTQEGTLGWFGGNK